MRPNIFQSRMAPFPCDSFFIWLLQWANEECTQYNSALHTVAQNFVRLLLDEECPIKKVIAGKKFDKKGL